MAEGMPAADVAEYRRRLEAARGVMREHGYDALVVGSGPPELAAGSINVGSHGKVAQPRYHRWFSGFHIWGAEGFGPQPVVVLLPLEGEPALIVRAGTAGMWTALARAHGWIENVVATYRDEHEWEWQTGWGLASPELPADVASAIREAGLAAATIGLVGSWPGLEQTLSALPAARFEPTFREDGDRLISLLDDFSAWELERVARSQAIADEAMRAFAALVAPGASIDVAVAEARYRALLAGAEDLIVEVGSGIGTWAVWVAPMQGRQARFRADEPAQVSLGPSVDGYMVQLPRTWAVGPLSRAEQRAFDVARASNDAVVERLRASVTGGELWDAARAPVEAAGLELRGRVGHTVGFTTISGPERFTILPGEDVPLPDEHAIVVHPCVWDRVGGVVWQLGDSFVVEGGRVRLASRDPVRYGP